MSQKGKVWLHLTLVSAVGLAAGYALRHPGRRGGDMLDAMAVVQRHSPRFLVSEPQPTRKWSRMGSVYLCRSPRSPEDLVMLSVSPSLADHCWSGVVCFKGTDYPEASQLARVTGKDGERIHHYSGFAAFGDPDELREVAAILEAAGFRRANN